MKKFKIFAFAAIALLMVCVFGSCCRNHVIAKDAAVAATCTENGLTEGSHCAKCDKVLEAQEEIPAMGHTVITSKAIAPTYTATGMTEGTFCRVCNQVLSGKEVIPRLDGSRVTDYASTDRYDNLATFEKGEAMQTMYRDLNDKLLEFHLDTTMDATMTKDAQHYTAATVCYEQYGLSLNEIQHVWTACVHDNPIYYWVDNVFRYNKEFLLICVDKDYIKGEARARYNEMLYEALDGYAALVEGETSPYRIALTYHDAILLDVEYAYDSNGNSESAPWAHNLIGVVEHGKTVCEGYAEMFQVLLNYSKVENISVLGVSEGRHMWNLVKMDDGCWYWCDLTWDDGRTKDEIRHQYFCVNDTQLVNWYDRLAGYASAFAGDQTFLDRHTPHQPNVEEPYNYQHPLPRRSEHAFDSAAVLTLRETFTVDGCTFAMVGCDSVKLIRAEKVDVLNVPETVTYNGITYRVVGACGMNAQGFFDEYLTITTSPRVTVPNTEFVCSRNAFASSAVTTRQ